MNEAKVFDPKRWRKLESDERRERMNPGKLLDALGLTGSERLLDIGCGTGFFAEALAPACGELVGVDRSEQMLAMFRGKPGFDALTNVTLRHAMADALPVEDGTVDVAFHVCLLHEVPDVPAFHAEIMRALRRGGRLVAIDWHARETEGGPPLDHRIPEEQGREWMIRDGFVDVRSFPLYADQYALEGLRPL